MVKVTVQHSDSTANRYTTLQCIYHCRGRAGVQPRLQSKPRLTDFGLQPYVALVCRFNGLHPSYPCRYTDYYSFTDPGGMEDWVGYNVWLTVYSLPTIDRAQLQESPPAKGLHPKDWATLPTKMHNVLRKVNEVNGWPTKFEERLSLRLATQTIRNYPGWFSDFPEKVATVTWKPQRAADLAADAANGGRTHRSALRDDRSRATRSWCRVAPPPTKHCRTCAFGTKSRAVAYHQPSTQSPVVKHTHRLYAASVKLHQRDKWTKKHVRLSVVSVRGVQPIRGSKCDATWKWKKLKGGKKKIWHQPIIRKIWSVDYQVYH